MIWLLLVCASTWFGFELVPFLRVSGKTYELRILLGWLVGSVLTGYAVYITNFVFPLNTFHALFYVVVEFSAAFKLRGRSKPRTELHKMPWLVFVLLLVAGVSLKYLAAVYKDVPYDVPFAFRPFLDEELSFIHCVMDVRRSNVLFYRDPRMSGRYYRGYAGPLLYVALLMKLGASYGDASIVVCFLNICATAYCVFMQAAKFTVWPWFATLLTMFNGCSAARLYFFSDCARMDIRNDLVHRITDKHETMAHQFLFSLMSFSKASSASIALAQYAMCYWSGPLAAIIPSVSASLGVFMTMGSMRMWNYEVWPYVCSLLLKVVPFSFSYWPLFREEMMRGTFCSSVKIWGDVFGLLSIPLLLNCVMVIARSPVANLLLAGLLPFCVLQFLREGSRYQNVVAVTGFYGSTLMVAVACGMRALRSHATTAEGYGGLCYLMWLVFAYYVAGGLICGMRIIQSKECVINHGADMELVSWIKELVPKTSVLLVEPKNLHPAVLAGRQLFFGDKRSIWANGINLQPKLSDLDAVINGATATEMWPLFGIQFIVEEIGVFEMNNTNVVRANDKYRLCVLN